jgi:carbon monoxide dehydrogenase subunit G
MKFSASVEINASPEKTWSLLKNIEEWPKWVPSLKKIEKVSAEPLGKGSKVLVVAKSLIKVNLLMTVTEFVAGQRVVMEGKVLGVRMVRFYELEPVSGRARLTAGGEVTGLLAFLVRRGGQKLSEEIVQALKRKVEGLA